MYKHSEKLTVTIVKHTYLLFVTAVPLVGIYLRGVKTYIQKDVSCSQSFIHNIQALQIA